jgi:hypothetical protein
MAFRIRLERAVRDPFDEELPVAFEEEFRDGANSAQRTGTHSGVP